MRCEDRRPDLGRIADIGRPRARRRRVARRPAESLQVAGESLGEGGRQRPEAGMECGRTVVREQELRRGQQRDHVRRADRSLVGGIEEPDRVDLVPEQLDAHGKGRRRREDIDDPAAPRELALAGDLEDGAVAEAEEVAEQRALRHPAADAEFGRRLRQVVRRNGVLEERLDARHEDPGAAAPPCGQRRDPRRGLVGDELASLVGECGPWFEAHDGVEVADPGRQFLGHAIPDLGVARHPQHALASRQDERRREVALGAVGNLGQARVDAVDAACRGAEAGPQVGERAGAGEERRQSRQVREPAAGAVAFARGTRGSAARPARLAASAAARAAVRSVVACSTCSSTFRSQPRRPRCGAIVTSRTLDSSLGVLGARGPTGFTGALGADLPPARLRPPHAIGTGRAADLAGRRHERGVRGPKFERVVPVRRLVHAVTRPRLDGIGCRVEELVEPLALVRLEGRQDVVHEAADQVPRSRRGAG